VTDSKIAKKIKADLDADSFIIKDVKQQEQKQKPSPPFITSSLTSAAAGKYKFSAAKTMKAAQALYESGMITYIRTDSVRCDSESIDFCRQWLTENNHDIPQKPNIYSTKKTAQDAHEAIRPTDIELTPKNVYLSNDAQKVYTLIWERFVASQMTPAIYDSTVVIVESSSGHQLKVNGKVLKYKGWLDIMDDLGGKRDKNVVLPKLKCNDNVYLIPPKVKSNKRATKPPPRFTEQKLIDELEKKGIGRPSTYAAIMSKITARNYVERKTNVFSATDRGKEVIDILISFFDFMEYKYTADMELQLDKIAENKLKYVDMLTEFYDPFKKQLKRAYNSENKDYGFRCDKCKKDTPMYLRNGQYGFYLSCVNFPACKYTISCDVVDDKPVIKKRRTKIIDDVRCPVCSSGMVLNTGGAFGPFYFCSEYPICKGKRKVPYGKKCPECNNELYATIYHGDSVLFCMGYPDCRHSEKLKEKIPDPKKLVKSSTMPKRVRRALK
jgi:DNA topoisomerase-1